MSYLNDWLKRRITAAQFLAESVLYLEHKTGLAPTQTAIDVAQKAADAFTQTVETIAVGYLNTHAPGLPAVLGTQIAVKVANDIQSMIAAASNVIADPEAAVPTPPASVVSAPPPSPIPVQP